MEFRLPRLPRDTAIVDVKTGNPLLALQRWWQSTVERIEAQEGSQDAVIADLAAAQADIIATQADLTAAQADILALQGDYSGLVGKDQTTVWATPTGTFDRTTFVAYAGQTVSNPPTQAEVQAIDDHVKLISQHLAALISDLRGNDVLT